MLVLNASMDTMMMNETGPIRVIRSMSPLATAYICLEAIVAALCVFGNGLVVVSFWVDRRLRTVTNCYILSLSITDILVGLLGIPGTAFSMATGRPHVAWSCILNHSCIVSLTTVSILHLLAVSLDRYIHVVHFSLVKRCHKMVCAVTIAFIAASWLLGLFVGSLPLLGWNKVKSAFDVIDRCIFLQVVEIQYMVFVFYATILLPTLPLLYFYRRIYHAAASQVAHANAFDNREAVRFRKVKIKRKVTRSLAVIVLAFLACWYPLHILNLVAFHWPWVQIPSPLLYGCIIVSHFNSALNPAIYAAMMQDFRRAMLHTLRCRSSLYHEPVALLLMPSFALRSRRAQSEVHYAGKVSPDSTQKVITEAHELFLSDSLQYRDRRNTYG